MEKKKRMGRPNGTATLRKTGDNVLSRRKHSGPSQNTDDVSTFLAPDANVRLHLYPGVALMQQTRADEKKILTSAKLLHDSLGR